MVFWWLFRKASCASSSLDKDRIVSLTEGEHAAPFDHCHQWLAPLRERIKTIGPRFDDGTINWQCGCMGGGSLAAHRCGFFFRKLYRCMSEIEDDEDATVKCPGQFVDWAACMQQMDGSFSFFRSILTEASHLAMRERFLSEAFTERQKEKKKDS